MSNLNELGLPGLYLKPLIQTQKLKSLSLKNYAIYDIFVRIKHDQF